MKNIKKHNELLQLITMIKRIYLILILFSSIVLGVDFTFFVWTDTHFGLNDNLGYRVDCVKDMNNLPDTLYPATIGGNVGIPSFVIHSGDICDSPKPEQWQDDDGEKNDDYVTCIKDLKYKTYEVRGNHDHDGDVVVTPLKNKYGNLWYSFDYKGVHFVGLDILIFWGDPSEEFTWLTQDLQKVGKQTPIIVFFHILPRQNPDGGWAGSELLSYQQLSNCLSGYNVILILRGHDHQCQHTIWNGIDAYCSGHVKKGYDANDDDTPTFAVVHITNNKLTVVPYDWFHNKWFEEDVSLYVKKDITGIKADTTAPTPPGTPTEEKSDVDITTTGEYTVYWEPSIDNESKIISYELQEMKSSQQDTWTTLSSTIHATLNCYKITGNNKEGLKYSYRVRAKNEEGLTSNWSDISDGISYNTISTETTDDYKYSISGNFIKIPDENIEIKIKKDFLLKAIRIYDIYGNKIIEKPGSEKIIWDGKDSQGCYVASGIYLIVIDFLQRRFVEKIIVVK